MAILIRPVREQLEHDRLIRHLQGKYKRRNDVAINVGDEQLAPVKIGGQTFFPDLVLTADRKLAGVVEVETGESVNDLEARWQWVNFSRAKVPFHLYVPVLSYDTARRLCAAHQSKVAEIWTYRSALDDFDLVRMHHDGSAQVAPSKVLTPSKPAAATPAPAPKPVPAMKPAAAQKAAPAPAPRPALVTKPAAKPAAKASPKVRPAVTAGAKKKPAKPAAKPAKKTKPGKPAKAAKNPAAPKKKKRR